MNENLKDYTSPIISTTPIMQTIIPSILEDNKELIQVVTVQSETGRRAPSPISSNKKKTRPKKKIKTKLSPSIKPAPTSSLSPSKNKVSNLSFFILFVYSV